MTDSPALSQPGLRTRVARFTDQPAVQNFILGVILFNAVILGLETSDQAMAVAGPLIKTLDALCLGVFVIEIALKIYGRGLDFSGAAGACSIL